MCQFCNGIGIFFVDIAGSFYSSPKFSIRLQVLLVRKLAGERLPSAKANDSWVEKSGTTDGFYSCCFPYSIDDGGIVSFGRASNGDLSITDCSNDHWRRSTKQKDLKKQPLPIVR